METWSSISVYDFFRTYNWEGKTSKLDDFDSVELREQSQSLLSLSLKDFLGSCNWKGYQEKQKISHLIQPSNDSLLNLTVDSFFQGIRWESTPKIAPISNKSSFATTNNLTSSDLNINNLSDLF
ncbi:hypothetical protein [Crocosphaera sp. Alani8]|uniref:hypothetical protein n=1 Tax=Crocosphaera sp. Alani8 TaxID=3038952 RepID=UPI00313B7E40